MDSIPIECLVLSAWMQQVHNCGMDEAIVRNGDDHSEVCKSSERHQFIILSSGGGPTAVAAKITCNTSLNILPYPRAFMAAAWEVMSG